MTAYQLTPVGPEGPEPLRMKVIYVKSYDDLLVENERLKANVEGWAEMWHDEVNRRIGVQNRLNRSMRVLASLARLAPGMPGLIEAARREIWRLDRGV